MASSTARVSVILPPVTVKAKLGLGRLYGYNTVSINGDVGRFYRIEVSDDMVHWTPLVEVTLANSTEQYMDWDSPTKPKRFYRAVWVQ